MINYIADDFWNETLYGKGGGHCDLIRVITEMTVTGIQKSGIPKALQMGFLTRLLP